MTGRVLDMETAAPVLAYVRQGNEVLALSGDDGRFSADVAVPARLLFTSVGYEPLTVDAYVDGDQGDIFMVPLVSTLDPMVIEVDGPERAGFPWWLLALALLVAASDKPPRRRR